MGTNTVESDGSGRRWGRWRRIVLALALLTAATGCGDDGKGDGGGGSTYRLDDVLRLNHIQVLGSHNSYHVEPQGRLGRAFPIAEFQYTHPPLDVQFATQGIRQIELDIFADPEGGLYADPIGAQLARDPFDVPALRQPGIKVLHVQDIDFQSNCWTFVECLSLVKGWSDANPGHVPMTILVEAKDDIVDFSLPGVPSFTVPVPFDREQLDRIDAEILSVFPREQLITPDDVRGTRDTLAEAVALDGWPTLGESRGRVLFALDNGGRVKAAYQEGHPSLRGRILFTDSSPGEDTAAFFKVNGPIGNEAYIQQLVADGFIVRTRADEPTRHARQNDTSMREAALASSAHFISTDYPVPDPDFGTGYMVEIPGGTPAGCNPVSAPPECTSLDIEDPALLGGF